MATAAFVALFVFNLPFPVVVLAAAALGAFGVLGRVSTPASTAARVATPWRSALTWLTVWLLPMAGFWMLLGSGHVLVQVALYFSQMAVLTFGGAYAVLGWVAQAAVDSYGWLGAPEMLDGLAMAETTPGPLIMVTQFVGFMAGFNQSGGGLAMATLAALVTTWVTFAPCFLWIFAGAPYAEAVRGNARLASALSAVTAAVVGVIANLAVWFAIHTLFAQTQEVAGVSVPVVASVDLWAVALTALALLVQVVWRIGPGTLIIGAGCSGMALRTLGVIG